MAEKRFLFNAYGKTSMARNHTTRAIFCSCTSLFHHPNNKSLYKPQQSLHCSRSLSTEKTSAPPSAALNLALKQIEKMHGKGVLMQLGTSPVQPDISAISTGSLVLDQAIGVGGLPKGRIAEIYGPESSGKTTLALHVIAEAQKQGGTCTFIDVEHALDLDYARAVGVNTDLLYLSQPDSGEQALEVTDSLVRSNAMSVIVVDSVAALIPRAELEGEMGNPHMAMQARLMSQAMRKLTPSVSKSKCVLIFINQVRQKIGVVYGNPEVTAGGNALKFYASVRMRVSRDGQPLMENGEAVGCRLKVKIVKNKVAPPLKEVLITLFYGTGFSTLDDLFDLGVAKKVIRQRGAHFAVTMMDKTLITGHGRVKFLEDLKTHSLQRQEELLAAINGKIQLPSMTNIESSTNSNKEELDEEVDESTSMDSKMSTTKLSKPTSKSKQTSEKITSSTSILVPPDASISGTREETGVEEPSSSLPQ